MADFSQQDIQGPNLGVQPQQAVAPANVIPQTLSTVAQGLGQLFAGAANEITAQKKLDKQNAADALMSKYARTVTGLNQAVAQGNKTLATAQREQRALFNQIVSNYPSLTEQLTKFNTSILGSEGLGDVLAKGTEVDQQIKADTKAATAAGFIQPSMGPAEQERGLQAYRDQQQHLNQLDYYSKKLQVQNQELSLTEKRESIANQRTQRANAAYDLQIKRNKQGLQMALSDITANYFSKTQGEIDEINKSNLPPEEKLARLDKLHNDFNAITIQARGVAGSDYVDGLAKPVFDMIQSQKDFASGKISADVLQNRVTAAQNRAMLPIMSDPTAASIIAVSKLTGNTFDPVILTNFGGHMVDLVKNNMNPENPPANPTPHDPDAKEGVKTYTGSIQDVTRRLAMKDPSVDDPKATMQELSAHVNQIVAGVNDFASAQRNPQQLSTVVDYFASPEFLQYQRMGGTIDQANLQGAINAVRINYGDKLVPAIQQEWERSKVITGVTGSAGGFPTMSAAGARGAASTTQENTQNAIEYRWTGKNVVFKPAKGLERNTSAVAKARELQSKLAPLINKSVMMRAHLDGSDDYTKYFRESEGEMFGQEAQGEQ